MICTPGMIVWLVSGSPPMVVVRVLGNGMDVVCAWFDHDGDLMICEFPAICLTQARVPYER